MEYELIKYNENLPFKIYISDAKNSGYHIHKEIELVFVLNGTVIYEIKNKRHKLLEQDLFLVNSFDMHSVIAEKGENILLVMQLDPLYFNQYCPGFSDYYFEDTSALSDNHSLLYNKISSNLANIILSLIKLNTGYKLSAVNSVSEIALTLVQNCRIVSSQQGDNEIYKQSRISELLKFIEENCTSEIKLGTLSKKMLISPGYISRFFKDTLGIGYVDYINKLRVTKSLNDLSGSKKSILDISIEHGFNDHRAYNRVFKKFFDMTPSEYRTSTLKLTKGESNELLDNYFSDTSKDYFKYLFEFIPKDNGYFTQVSVATEKLNINADLTKSTEKKINKYWQKIISIESAALILISEIQSQIKTAQKELKYEFIRFQGIFSDEMRFYREDSSGTPLYNWYYIDLIIDFLYETNLKPFIVIGYMPEALASKKQYAPLFWPVNVSYPKSLKKWTNLVSSFINHCIDRYGKAEVETWYFEVWNAPELSNIFWYESKESFFEFYKETYLAIKKVSTKFKVGSPGGLPIKDFEWFNDFLNYCANNSIVIDFAACHIFTTTDPQNQTLPKEILGTKQIDLSISDGNYLQKSVDLFKNRLNAVGLSDLDLFVTEWNLSPYTFDYNRDTCFQSTYIVHNILSNLDRINSLAYLSLTDVMMIQGPADSALFHGGSGLLTYNGIRKPSFNAFLILNKLGINIVDHGKDYIITSEGANYQIILYNFAYFDDLFKTGDKSLLTYHERYNILESASEKDVSIVLNIKSGLYKIERYKLSRESGSSFDAWIKMGAPEEIQSRVYDYLKSKEIPDLSISTETVKGQLVLNDTLPVHCVLLIEINRLN